MVSLPNTPRISRNAKSVIRPASIAAIREQCQWQPAFLRVYTERNGASIDCDHPIRSAIVVLFARRRPSAIAELVVAIVVKPIQRITGRAPAHVGKKRGEVVSPSLTHRDSAPAVQSPFRTSLAKAPFFGREPRAVFAATVRFAVAVGPMTLTRWARHDAQLYQHGV